MQSIAKVKSPIRAAFEEGKRLSAIHGAENVFDLSIGNPQIPAPQEVADALREAAECDPVSLHGYMCDAGFEDVRCAVAQNLNTRFGLDVSSSQVIMTVGAAGAMNIAMYAVIDPNDEVVVFAPYYPGYDSFALNWNAKLVAVRPDEQTLQPDLADFKKRISPRTKMVIVNSPNNPSGVVYSQETAEALCVILREKQEEYGHEIYLMSDEPYRELLFEDVVLPQWLRLYDNAFMAYSFSKSLSLPGERIGYLVVSPSMSQSADVISAARTAQGMLGFVNAPATMQKVVARCIDCSVNVEAYCANRDALLNALVSLGFECAQPQGAFYLFVKAPGEGDEHSRERALLEAAHDCNVMLVGGSAFGLPGYARISFCVTHEVIQRAIPAFEKMARLLGLTTD